MTMRPSVVLCKEVYEEGNFEVKRPLVDNPNSKPVAFLIDSIFVKGVFLNYAQDFVSLLMCDYNVYVAGWNNNINHASSKFGLKDYSRCVASGVKATKLDASEEKIELLVAYSSGLGVTLEASEQSGLGINSVLLVGSPYSFRTRWAETYRNYRMTLEDDIIEHGRQNGWVAGEKVDERFSWMDKKYNALMGAAYVNPSDFGESYKHLNMPLAAYSDWMDVVRYNQLEAKDIHFGKEDIEYAAVLYGYKDYMTDGMDAIQPLITRMNLGSKMITLGADLGHRELLGIRALRHLASALDFLRD
jgi:hypothetical protein